MIPAGTLSKISSIRHGTLGKSRTTHRAAGGGVAGNDPSGGNQLGATEEGSVLGISTEGIKR